MSEQSEFMPPAVRQDLERMLESTLVGLREGRLSGLAICAQYENSDGSGVQAESRLSGKIFEWQLMCWMGLVINKIAHHQMGRVEEQITDMNPPPEPVKMDMA